VISRPDTLNLSNWRLPPNNRWAFHHVREIIPTESIPRGDSVSELDRAIVARVSGAGVSGPEGEDWSLQDWLEVSNSDALLVAHQGKIVHEWYVDPAIETSPHIVFSVSKSMTATLAGVLVDQGKLDPTRLVTEYIPELADSGYRDVSLQNLLDMQVDIDFEEDYLATSGKFVEYRTATAWHPCAVTCWRRAAGCAVCQIPVATDGCRGGCLHYARS
jgi:CubicO group peptidase (beta-lactamase class C family)